ncbi:hypothetical protein ABZ721_38570 [Streptomyces sp. NPDC006733]|uniref:hypothetical protein n=1 Tax=Streptomyces sp. NPDC006733 TaxID=3155460 RepID=UPI0033FA7CD6
MPRGTLPGWVRTAGDLLPLTRAARALAAGGARRSALPGVGAELVVAAGYRAPAVVLLRIFERGSRKRATLDVMQRSPAARHSPGVRPNAVPGCESPARAVIQR